MTTYQVPFTMSRHAMNRALEMGLDGEDVRAAILNPRYVGPAPEGREYRTRGKVTAVVTQEIPMTVVTLLWATVAAWQNDHDTLHSRTDRDQVHVNKVRRTVKSQRRKTRGTRGYGS